MKKIIMLLLGIIVFCSFNQILPKKLKDLKVFYHDTHTEKGKDIYREFNQVGEDPWAKPSKMDIVLSVDNLKMSNGRIELLIEELYEPTSLNKVKKSIQDERWIPNKVIFTQTVKAIQLNKQIENGKLTIKDVPYLSAGYSDSMLYIKSGFRVVAIYFDEDTKQFERLEHEILIPE